MPMEHQLGSTTTTRVISQEFGYAAPSTLEDALALLDEHGDSLTPLAGGTDLLLQLKTDQRSERNLMYINELEALDGITETSDRVELGATVTYDDLIHSPVVRRELPILAEAAGDAGGVQIEQMGTLGGNLCNASPAASAAPPLLVHDASVTLESADGERVVALEDFFTGPKQTVLRPNELLTGVRVPKTDAERWAHEEVKRVTEDLAKAIVSVVFERDGDTVVDCRIALGCLAPVPVRASEAEAALQGEPADETAFRRAGERAKADVNPITDARSTAEYRELITETKVRDLLMEANDTHGN
ncbi:MAG: xanthine dehydrogenase family protein subunit M [Halovenus sp.]